MDTDRNGNELLLLGGHSITVNRARVSAIARQLYAINGPSRRFGAKQ